MSEFLRLETEDGRAYVKRDQVSVVASLAIKKSRAQSLRVTMLHNGYFFCLLTPDNLRALGLDDEADELQAELDARAKAEAPPARRTRKAKP
jgi:hypothetical protein